MTKIETLEQIAERLAPPHSEVCRSHMSGACHCWRTRQRIAILAALREVEARRDAQDDAELTHWHARAEKAEAELQNQLDEAVVERTVIARLKTELSSVRRCFALEQMAAQKARDVNEGALICEKRAYDSMHTELLRRKELELELADERERSKRLLLQRGLAEKAEAEVAVEDDEYRACSREPPDEIIE